MLIAAEHSVWRLGSNFTSPLIWFHGYDGSYGWVVEGLNQQAAILTQQQQRPSTGSDGKLILNRLPNREAVYYWGLWRVKQQITWLEPCSSSWPPVLAWKLHSILARAQDRRGWRGGGSETEVSKPGNGNLIRNHYKQSAGVLIVEWWIKHVETSPVASQMR